VPESVIKTMVGWEAEADCAALDDSFCTGDWEQAALKINRARTRAANSRIRKIILSARPATHWRKLRRCVLGNARVYMNAKVEVS